MNAARSPDPAVAEVVASLRRAVGGEVDASARRRAEYSSDASNYRVVPQVVVFPRDVDDVVAAAEVCRTLAVPLTVRGGGTSVAGNAVGPGVVLDLSRHVGGIVDVDPAARTATVEPGVVLDDLQRAVRPHGLRFGPDPSTHARCTIGGMIGNNACGAHTIAYGRTADNVVSLDVLDGAGRRFTAGRGLAQVPGLSEVIATHATAIRAELGRFGRQVSGYGLEHLLPERGGYLAKALVGTEGTCGVVLRATVRLVRTPAATALAVLGFPDMATAADAVPDLIDRGPLAVEGIDGRIVDVVRAHRAGVPDLPRGRGWLLVETGGSTRDEALGAARAICAAVDVPDTLVVPAGERASALWRIREDGAGLAGRTPDGRPAWPAWEDAAVPPDVLGAYLRDFAALERDHGVDGLAYGHFGDGCVHVRLDLPLADHPDRLRPFLRDAAQLVTRHGGSLSGEHGDGRARGELLPIMYSSQVLDAFAAFKHCLDPRDLLNPGVVVRPRPVDADLRLPAARPLPLAGGFAFAADGGDLSTAVHRCVGLGKCRADNSPAGGVMCPSFLATRDERDSTRGRARVLQEMANGRLVTDGPRSAEVHDVLDLCLSCKACASDCPAGVDMATYKAEVLHRAYRRRPRPATHYSLGWLPRWTRAAALAPRLANGLLRWAPLRRLVQRAGGMDPRRDVPAFAERPFRRTWRERGGRGSGGEGERQRAGGRGSGGEGERQRAGGRGSGGAPVALWVDTFTDAFAPAAAYAAIAVLRAAGYDVLVPPRACCGLTWITTGQLTTARRRLRRLLDVLEPYAARGIPVVGLEPSCTAVLRSDLGELLPEDPRAGTVASVTRTLAELLADAPAGWDPPRLDGVEIVAQPHCHQHAVMGFAAERAMLQSSGASVRTVAGCCGLAGNFGMERGHYDVSVAVAGNALLPALRDNSDAVYVADGFSCRLQAAQLAGRPGVHLAELLAARLPGA